VLLKTSILFAALLCLLVAPDRAAGQLRPGDIVIIGIHSDGDDRFAWVPLVDLAPGQVIYFTDAGWNAAGNAFQRQVNAKNNPSTTSPSGGAIRYTVPPEGLPAGRVVEVRIDSRTEGEPGAYVLSVSGASAADFTGANDTDVVGDQGVSIATTGDKLFVLIGSLLQPAFLFGVNIGANRWHLGSTTAQHSSDLPPGLADGVSAVAIGTGPTAGDEVDNGRYAGPVTGTREEIRAAVADPANWEGSDDEIPDLTNGASGFTVLPPPRVAVALDTLFAGPGDTAYVALSARAAPAHDLGALRFRLVVDRPDYALFSDTPVVDTPEGAVIEVSRANAGDTLTVVLTADPPLLLIPEEALVLGRFRLIAKPGALGVETPVRLLDEAGFAAQDSRGYTLDRAGAPGALQIGKRGDINRDGRISILDVIQLVNRLIGGQLPVFPYLAFALADANGDQRIDIVDVIWQVNVILGIPAPQGAQTRPTAGTPARAYFGPVQRRPDGSAAVPLSIESRTPIAGVDATLVFDPAGLRAGKPLLAGAPPDAVLDSRETAGRLHVVAVSLSSLHALVSGAMPFLLIPVTLMEGLHATLTLASMVLVDRQGQRVPVDLSGASQTLHRAAAAPAVFSLHANAPNPFNPSTTIAYTVPRAAHMTLTVYNLLGQEVVRLVDRRQEAGRYTAIWDARNARGEPVSSGVYLYRLTSDTGYTATRRMTVVK
jgi:hypothetical protein